LRSKVIRYGPWEIQANHIEVSNEDGNYYNHQEPNFHPVLEKCCFFQKNLLSFDLESLVIFLFSWWLLCEKLS